MTMCLLTAEMLLYSSAYETMEERICGKDEF